MSRDDVVREVMSILDIKYKPALKIVKLSAKAAETYEMIGSRATGKRPMSQSEALRLVTQAKERIALVDEGD